MGNNFGDLLHDTAMLHVEYMLHDMLHDTAMLRVLLPSETRHQLHGIFLHCNVSVGSKICNNSIQLEMQKYCITCWQKMLLLLVHLYKICKRVKQSQDLRKVQWMKTFIKITSSFYQRKCETKPCMGSLFSLCKEICVLYYMFLPTPYKLR